MRKPVAVSCCEPRPNIKAVELIKSCSKFGEDEDDLIIKLHALLGNRWSLIAGRLPGRTGNEVKKYWNKHLKGKLLRMGKDPNHHRLAGFPMPSTPRPTPTPAFDPAADTKTIPVHQHNISETQMQTQESAADTTTTTTTMMSTPPPELNLELTIGPPTNLATT